MPRNEYIPPKCPLTGLNGGQLGPNWSTSITGTEAFWDSWGVDGRGWDDLERSWSLLRTLVADGGFIGVVCIINMNIPGMKKQNI